MYLHKILSYIALMRPPYLISNSLAVLAGFLFGSSEKFDGPLFSVSLVSATLLAAATIIVNRYLNKDLDYRISQGDRRVDSIDGISRRNAFVFAGTIGLVGLALVYFFINILTIMVVFVSGIFYIGLSGTAWRRLKWGKVLNNIPAALVVLYGYMAAANILDTKAVVVCLSAIVIFIAQYYFMAYTKTGFVELSDSP